MEFTFVEKIFGKKHSEGPKDLSSTSKPQSPYEVIDSTEPKNEMLSAMISRGLRPRIAIPDYNFVPLPKEDQEYKAEEDKVTMFVCSPRPDGNGKQAAFYLDPKVWIKSLLEFQAFAMSINPDEDLRLQVVDHIMDKPEYQSILIRAVTPQKLSSDVTFSLKPNGMVSVGNETVGVHSLGYLDPQRTSQEALEKFKSRLKPSVEDR